ncbi:MAG: hypothetical protein RL499_642 [Actinomycetota bacterium]
MSVSRTTGSGDGGSRSDESRFDGSSVERLAPVIYLPGVREAAAQSAAEAERETRAAAAREALAAAEAEAARNLDSREADARQAVAHHADARRAENVTLHAITRRGQSRAEVADLLRRREIDPIVAEAELDRLESVGLIDDRALAADLVDRLRSRKKLGPSALRAELMRRKLDRSAIDEVLAMHDDDAADDDLVVELARDRARRLGGLDRATAERRLIDFLARKGHSGSSAREAARRALDRRDSELDEDGAGRPRGSAASRVEFR